MVLSWEKFCQNQQSKKVRLEALLLLYPNVQLQRLSLRSQVAGYLQQVGRESNS